MGHQCVHYWLIECALCTQEIRNTRQPLRFTNSPDGKELLVLGDGLTGVWDISPGLRSGLTGRVDHADWAAYILSLIHI